MRTLHLCNTQFEFDLQQTRIPGLIQGIEANSICLQLQFLPCLYVGEQDLIGVTALPDPLPHPGLRLLQELPEFDEIQFWGASPALSPVMAKLGNSLKLPDWSTVRRVNSKAFSFSQSPPLPDSALLTHSGELESWWKTRRQVSVLKSCFGVAGRGKLLLKEDSPLNAALEFCQKQWKLELPVIAEPWLPRLLDFSSQWEIHADGIEYLGPTLMENTAQGGYQSSLVGSIEDQLEPYLNEHLEWAKMALQKIQKAGYWGPVGVDAMVYLDPEPTLHPIVEINARQTMACTALKYQQKIAPESTLSLIYGLKSKSETGLLPSGLLKSNGDYCRFSRNLFSETLT